MQPGTPHVDLLATRSGGAQEAVMRFYLEGDAVRLIALTKATAPAACAELLEELKRTGARGAGRGERVFPREGIRFLEALRYHFDGIYLRATQVQR